MKRIISLLAVMAIMAAMVAAMAVPAFAAASDNAGCKGFFLSTLATQAPPGFVGELVSSVAPGGEIGQEFGGIRSCNGNASEQGGGGGF